MTRDNSRLVEDYLARLEAAAERLPASRRRDLIEDMREHIEVSLAERDAPSDAEIRQLLERLGDPEEIVTAALAEDPRSVPPAAPASGARELGAVLCYLFGGVFVWFVGPVFALAWIAGAALLWWSKVWTRWDKLLGSVAALAGAVMLPGPLMDGVLGPMELAVAYVVAPVSLAIGIYLKLRARQLGSTRTAEAS